MGVCEIKNNSISLGNLAFYEGTSTEPSATIAPGSTGNYSSSMFWRNLSFSVPNTIDSSVYRYPVRLTVSQRRDGTYVVILDRIELANNTAKTDSIAIAQDYFHETIYTSIESKVTKYAKLIIPMELLKTDGTQLEYASDSLIKSDTYVWANSPVTFSFTGTISKPSSKFTLTNNYYTTSTSGTQQALVYVRKFNYGAGTRYDDGSIKKSGYLRWHFNDISNWSQGNNIDHDITVPGDNLQKVEIYDPVFTIKSDYYNYSNFNGQIGSIVIPDTNYYSEPGYNYTQWINGSTKYNAGSSVKLWSNSTNTTGTWSFYFTPDWQTNEYTVIFNKNKGSGSTEVTGTMESQSRKYKDSQELTDNGFNRIGYTFSGWANTEGGSAVFANKSIADIVIPLTPTGTIANLYAVWTPKTYGITLHKQLGTGGLDNITATFDANLPTLSSTELPTRTGYLFKGYYTGKNGTGDKYIAEDGTGSKLWQIDGSGNLYAYWVPITYKVRFNKNNSSAQGSMADQTFSYDKTKALTANAFSLTDHGFKYWTLISADSGTHYSNEQSVSNLTATNNDVVNLYAQWKKAPGCRVKISNNQWAEVTKIFVKTSSGWQQVNNKYRKIKISDTEWKDLFDNDTY